MVGINSCLNQKNNGFTLLEIMVALSIFSILVVASHYLFTRELSNQKRIQTQSEVTTQCHRAIRKLDEDIAQIINRPVKDEWGEIEPTLLGSHNSITFTHTGWLNPLELPRGQLQRVTYEVESINRETHLIRKYWPAVDRARDTSSFNQILLKDIREFELRFYSESQNTWSHHWPIDPKTVRSLPSAIELRISSNSIGEIKKLYTLAKLK